MNRRMVLTKAEQRAFDRYSRWQSLRGELRSADKRIARAKRLREDDLAELRIGCEAAAKAVRAKCATARKKIRQTARDTERKEREHKRFTRVNYSALHGRSSGRGRDVRVKKMSREESDSLAEHAIPPELIEIWRADRRRYSYDKAPDHRAELFLEWAEAHGDEISQRMQEKLEQQWGDLAYAQDLAAHDAERDEEEVPF